MRWCPSDLLKQSVKIEGFLILTSDIELLGQLKTLDMLTSGSTSLSDHERVTGIPYSMYVGTAPKEK